MIAACINKLTATTASDKKQVTNKLKTGPDVVLLNRLGYDKSPTRRIRHYIQNTASNACRIPQR